MLYHVTFEIDARDRRDAEHWAQWVAGYETIMRDVYVLHVRRFLQDPAALSLVRPPEIAGERADDCA